MQEIIECACGCGETLEKYDKYGRARKYKVAHNKTKRTIGEAYEKFVVKGDGCWGWSGALCAGYGSLRYRQKHYRAHRLSYELHVGPIPEGMYVLHKCDNRACSNPDHLFVGSQKDNMMDMVNKGRQTKYRKLSSEDIDRMRDLRDSGLLYREIASAFRCGRNHVSQILRGGKYANAG